MRRFAWLVVALVHAPSALLAQQTLPNLRVDGVPPIAPATIERTAPYKNARSAELLDFAPCGRLVLIATRFGDLAKWHKVAGPGRNGAS